MERTLYGETPAVLRALSRQATITGPVRPVTRGSSLHDSRETVLRPLDRPVHMDMLLLDRTVVVSVIIVGRSQQNQNAKASSHQVHATIARCKSIQTRIISFAISIVVQYNQMHEKGLVKNRSVKLSAPARSRVGRWALDGLLFQTTNENEEEYGIKKSPVRYYGLNGVESGITVTSAPQSDITVTVSDSLTGSLTLRFKEVPKPAIGRSDSPYMGGSTINRSDRRRPCR
eukprot:1937536-Pleurochrysis_carterae.AAC.1